MLLRDLAESVLKTAQEHKLQGETEVQGIPVAIENRAGSVREGTTEDGHHWRTKMKVPYGYIKGTKGADGEEIDAFVGPDKEAPKAYVVHQHKPDGTGFDEDKVMLGFRSLTDAKKTYLQHYDDPKFLGPISAVPVEELKEKVEKGGVLKKIASAVLLMRQLSSAAQEAGLQIEKLGEANGGLVVLVYDDSELEKVAEGQEVDPRFQRKVKGRFERFTKALEAYGDPVGTGHKRLLIPKKLLGEKELTQNLGFVPVKVAIPEAGQTRFESFRNPYNLYHIHEHGDSWIMHEDQHPASTMLMKKWMMERAQKAKAVASEAASKAKATAGHVKEHGSSVLKPVGDFIRGLPHVVTEGLPGAYYYAKGRISSAPGMRERLEQVTPKEYLRRIRRWKPFSTEEAAPAEAPVEDALPKAASADLLRKLAEVALTGKGEFAPGIPSSRKIQPIPRVKATSPQTWQMALQQHEAERAGAHADLRLVDNQGRAHSWAIPKGKLPAPGEKLRVIPQPTHTQEYAGRTGEFEISEGYGKGKVRSTGLQPVEVVKAQPGRIVRFNVYGGQKDGNQEYALIQTPRGQLLHNITTTAETGVRGPGGHPIPQSKPKYKEVSTDRVRFDDADEIHQAKVDGAHVTFHLRDGKGVKVFSYRPTERATGVLEHTHKLPAYRKLTAPPGLAGTVLRGELYAADKETGKALPAEQVGGLLNSTVWRSREKQKELGAEIRPVIFDVVRYKGRDVSNAPYSEKLQILKEVEQKIPRLKLPPTAATPEEKEALFRRIREGQEPITGEGIVAWKLPYPYPTKAKFKPDVDAEVVGVTPGKGKHEGRIGALVVRLPGKDATTHVGTGLSDELRDQIAKNPEEYIGRVAKVRTMQVFPSGRLRAPAFAGFHLEKGKQPMEGEK